MGMKSEARAALRLSICGVALMAAAGAGVSTVWAQATDPAATPVVPVTDTTAADTTATDSTEPATDTTDSALSAEDQADADAALAAARAAITAGDLPAAIRYLNKVLSFPENPASQEAQELLGVSRERNGQLAHAKAEYETYLAKYPGTEGAVRVEQRLTAIKTAEAAPPPPLREPATVTTTTVVAAADPVFDPVDANLESVKVARPDIAAPAPRVVVREVPVEDEDVFPQSEIFGSIGSTYYYNQGSTILQEYETSRTTEDDFVYENALVTSLDLEGRYETQDSILTWRISADHEADFLNGFSQSIQLSKLYGQIEYKDSGTRLSFGRQSLNNSGVFGRFDGGRASFKIGDNMRLNVQGGSPVDSVRDPLFQFDRTMLGVSLDYEDIVPGGNLTVYAIEQRAGSLTDRRAVGAEFQYSDDHNTLNASFDHDIYFNKLNFARISGTHIYADNSSLTLSADYVMSPYLSLTNALQGQTITTLSELVAANTLAEVEQWAVDRTTPSSSISAAYSHPLNETWQITADATVFDTSGSPASGGVPAVPAPGLEYYASVGFVGTGVFSDTDVVATTFRYANTASSVLYHVDSYLRYDVTDKLRVKPRLKVGYRDLTSGGHEVFAVPSITANYEIAENTDFELELGDNWSRTTTSTTKESANDVYVFVGLRRDF
ncbi:tol-pal system YbgF family protein [Actibacterium sp.]|uniref:tetratricopeptide repeat protein n=1 Tax=Actibacterium sp. TaxID=1872125 RepID=UPI0035674DD8